MAGTDFNPIKEEVGGKKAHAMIWSTKTLETALKGLEQGRKLIANPFYENNTRLLKSDLVFKRTPEEIEEFKKCMNDILYFANKYCQLMTPEGVKHIKLRDYQEKYLEQVTHNQMNIMLSARQAGKCVSPITTVQTKIDCREVKNKKIMSYYKGNDVFELPLFEIENLYKTGVKWSIKYIIYKMIYRLTWLVQKLQKKTDGKH